MNTRKIIIITSILLIMIVLYLIPAIRNSISRSIVNNSAGLRNLIYKQPESVTSSEELLLLRAQTEILTQENRRLEQELGLRPLDLEQAPVRLMTERSKIYSTTYVDTTGININTGSYIYANQNVVAGNIDSVEGNIAKVIFLGNKEKFLAEIVKSGEIIELSGNGIGYYKGSVPKTDTLQVGDTIALKGYPKSIVGTITSIENDDTSVSTIWVRSPINLLKIDIFYVNKN